MRAKSVSEFRKNIAADMDRVVDDHTPLIVTRSGKKTPVVVVSLADYEALDETAYLLASPKNAKRLLKGIRDFEKGKGIRHPLPE